MYNVLDIYTIPALNKLICSHFTHKITFKYANTENMCILISTNTINNILNKYTISTQTTGNDVIVLFTEKIVNLYTIYGSIIDISCKGFSTTLESIETDYYIGLTKGTMHFAMQYHLLKLPKNIDISKVYNMSRMFLNSSLFNCDLLHWDVSHIVNMTEMFYGAHSFNGDISNWNVYNVREMIRMFYEAYSFNCDISNWRVDNVKRMEYMFYNAKKFNCMYPYGNLNTWNVKHAKITKMFLYSNIHITNYIDKWPHSTYGILFSIETPGQAVQY